MKTFEDLKFIEHPNKPFFNKQARMDFDNGYGVSVINGQHAYCSDSTYEVAIMYKGSLTYNTDITDDVIGHQSEKQVTEIMKQVQELK